MVKLSDNLHTAFPDLTFFVVDGQWNSKFQPKTRIKAALRVFCTLENSLGMKSVFPFLHFQAGSLFSIEIWRPEINNRLEWEMNSIGIAFAETGKVYRKDDLEELKSDYLIAKLSGLRQ